MSNKFYIVEQVLKDYEDYINEERKMKTWTKEYEETKEKLMKVKEEHEKLSEKYFNLCYERFIEKQTE